MTESDDARAREVLKSILVTVMRVRRSEITSAEFEQHAMVPLREYAARMVEAERERCARIASEAFEASAWHPEWRMAGLSIAAAIRSKETNRG